MDYTGERMIPGKSFGQQFWEHVYRYRFAAQFVREKRVADVACGEGYGSAALLRAGARAVIGVDVDPAACTHAASRYGVDACCGDAAELPLEDSSVDLFVSFETIEHLDDPRRFLFEVARVLAPMGTALISTPNKEVYPAGNVFHRHELTTAEFMVLIGECFRDSELFYQFPTAARGPLAFEVGMRNPLVHWFAQRRGGWRLLTQIRRLAYGAAWLAEGPKELPNAVEAILRPLPPWTKPFDPYRIRAARHDYERARPMYLLAAVRGPQKIRSGSSTSVR